MKKDGIQTRKRKVKNQKESKKHNIAHNSTSVPNNVSVESRTYEAILEPRKFWITQPFTQKHFLEGFF